MTRVFKNIPRKNFCPLTPFIIVIAVLLLSLFPQTAAADALTSPRVYTRGSSVYVVEPKRIVFLSMDTRGSHTLYTASDSLFELVSATRTDDVIWASNGFGAVIAVNMQTGTVDEYGRGRAGAGGQIEVDRRYVWAASSDTLYRMDRISREWTAIPFLSGNSAVRGIASFNDFVHVVTDNAVYIYNPLTGDRSHVPHRGFVLGEGDFHRVAEHLIFTRDRTVYRYDPSKRLWSSATVGNRIRTVNFMPDHFAVATENRVYHINTGEFTLVPRPAIPMLRGIRSITLHNGNTVCVVENGIATYTSVFDFDLAVYPEHINITGDVFAFSHLYHIILYTGGAFAVYHPERRTWSGVRVISRSGERKPRTSWDEDGAQIVITDEYKSSLGGILTLRQEPGAVYTEEGGLELETGTPLGNATLNLRTEDADGRVLDLYIDNGVYTQPPRKGFSYRGLEGDVFDRASLGVQATGLTASGVTPNVLAEGASAAFSSKTRAENRDRGVVSATVGSGYVLTKTQWNEFGFNPSGVYDLHAGNGREIDPASVRVYIDGVPLSEAEYVYNSANRSVRLLRRDRTYLATSVQVSFSARALPDDPFAFEPLPTNHFGQYNFAEGVISPRSWLSARVGVLTLDDGGTQGIAPMALAGLPVEFRSGANRSLTLYPEVAYDAETGAHASGITMGLRENKAFGSYRGTWASRDYLGIDRPMYANRSMSEEHELNAGYDLLNNWRASWYQIHRRAADGYDLSHFELRSLYTGNGFVPDIEASTASRSLDVSDISSRRETFSLRMSDLSSRLLGTSNRLHNVGYDIAWTEYRNNGDQRGRVVHGALNVSPVSSLTFTGQGTYRKNPQGYHARTEIDPSISIQARDLPRGVDASAGYYVHSSEYSDGVNGVMTVRYFFGHFYPGAYASSLDNLIIYAGHTRETYSQVPPLLSPLRYVFLTDGNTSVHRATEELGALFFPAQNLLLSSVGAIHRDKSGLATTYTTHERAKLWFENGNNIGGNIRTGNRENWLYLNADAMYEHKWNRSLLTGIGAFGTRDAQRDSTGVNTVNVHGGPALMAAITKEMGGFVRSVENSHRIWVTLHQDDLSAPGIDYSFLLRLRMRPNMALVAEMNIAIARTRDMEGFGGIYLHAGF